MLFRSVCAAAHSHCLRNAAYTVTMYTFAHLAEPVCRSKEEILEEIKQLQNEMAKYDEHPQAETAASKEN